MDVSTEAEVIFSIAPSTWLFSVSGITQRTCLLGHVLAKLRSSLFLCLRTKDLEPDLLIGILHCHFSCVLLLLLLLSRFSCVRPHRRQPTRLPRPWDSPGKNTGVGCQFLFRCRKVKRESEVTQSCPTLSDPMDCSLPGSSVHGIFQARVLE